MYLVTFYKFRINLFNLDSAPTRAANPDYQPTENGIKDNSYFHFQNILEKFFKNCDFWKTCLFW